MGKLSDYINYLVCLVYQYTLQGCCHTDCKAILVGWVISRNQDQLTVLETVRYMVETSNAIAMMGNHELNAIGWHTKYPTNTKQYLRPHTEKNRIQHQAFLDAVEDNSPLHKEWVDWFKTLPLFLDMEGLRVVHTCWVIRQ